MLRGSPLAFLTPGTLPWPTSWSRSSPACTPHTRIWPSPTACAPTSRGWGRNRSGWRKRPRICSTPLTRWCTRCRISKRTGRLVCRGRDCLEGTKCMWFCFYLFLIIMYYVLKLLFYSIKTFYLWISVICISIQFYYKVYWYISKENLSVYVCGSETNQPGNYLSWNLCTLILR